MEQRFPGTRNVKSVAQMDLYSRKDAFFAHNAEAASVGNMKIQKTNTDDIKNHSSTCSWHKDWHDCSCGVFDYDHEQLVEQQQMETCFGVLYTGEEVFNKDKE